MPLARGADGRLGILARGGSGQAITINIATADVESFRRSESQLAAIVARVAAQGQRNL
jgi:phage-related minor tail protein